MINSNSGFQCIQYCFYSSLQKITGSCCSVTNSHHQLQSCKDPLTVHTNLCQEKVVARFRAHVTLRLTGTTLVQKKGRIKGKGPIGRNQNMKLHCGCILGSRKIFVQFRLKGSFKLLENIRCLYRNFNRFQRLSWCLKY